MKKARIINLAVFVALFAGLITTVCCTWYKKGCGKESVWVAIIVIAGLGFIGWRAFDNSIKDYFKNK